MQRDWLIGRRKDIMTDSDEIYELRGQYSAAMGDYEAATDALRQFDRDLFDGLILDLGTVVWWSIERGVGNFIVANRNAESGAKRP